MQLVYRSGKLNVNADALSRAPYGEAPIEGIAEEEVQVSLVQSASSLDDQRSDTVQALLQQPPLTLEAETFANEQARDSEIREMVDFLRGGKLPDDDQRARYMTLQRSLFTLEDEILYYLDRRQQYCKRAVVPRHLREQVLAQSHSSMMSGHFSGKKTYGALIRHWWWDGMYSDTLRYARNCPDCATVLGGGRRTHPPLVPIPVQRPFQIVGVDIMEMPKTEDGNRYILVFQDFLTKWPLAFAMPDQKSERIARILVQEVIPLFGVPEALLSDRGTNLLSHLMLDLCSLLGIRKLNTTAHHPQCDGMVERFNRTLKTMLRKHVAKLGTQWDRYLHGVMWAYPNVPHDSTGEKPSFLLLGVDCRSPTEAALLPPHDLEVTEVSDYREEMVLSLSTARKMAAESIRKAQAKYKRIYDRDTRPVHFNIGDWVLVKFPQDEAGKQRKLSRPWRGPFRVVKRTDPDLTVTKVYAPEDGVIKIHQSRVTPCPPEFPAGYYWYGGRRAGPGRPPKWVDALLQGSPVQSPDDERGPEHSLTEPEGEGDPTVENVPDARVVLAEEHSVNDPPDAAARTRTGGKYSLRKNPPPRVWIVRSGRAHSEEEEM